MNNRIVIDLPSLLGVDADTYRRADNGDRQAQKRILRSMWTRNASPRALASSLPWTSWLLRVIGSGSEQTIADFWGVVDVQRRTGRLPATKADALDRLMEQFVGPGTVDAGTVGAVRRVFAADAQEQKVIELFLLHDRLASGDTSVTLREIDAGVRLSEQLGSDGAHVFFLGVWAQHTAQGGNVAAAIRAAEVALGKCDKLVKSDPEYQHRLGVTATLLRQLYGFVRDAQGVNRIGREYRGAMEAYSRRQRE
jgi:hypothetical protein